MWGPVIARLKALIDGEDQTPQRSTNLYECGDCETVYISEEMDACPECGCGVESVPTERDLGIG